MFERLSFIVSAGHWLKFCSSWKPGVPVGMVFVSEGCLAASTACIAVRHCHLFIPGLRRLAHWTGFSEAIAAEVPEGNAGPGSFACCAPPICIGLAVANRIIGMHAWSMQRVEVQRPISEHRLCSGPSGRLRFKGRSDDDGGCFGRRRHGKAG